MNSGSLPPLTRDGRCSDPHEISAVAREFGFELLTGPAIAEARALAASLLGEGIASVDCYRMVQEIVGTGVFGLRESGGPLVGLSASFPLSQAGLDAIRSNTFDGVDLDCATLSRPGQTPAAYYGWGFAGATRAAASTVLRLSRAIHRRLFWGTPTYTRAVTAEGMRACLGIGFSPAPGDDLTLLWIPPNVYKPTAAR